MHIQKILVSIEVYVDSDLVNATNLVERLVDRSPYGEWLEHPAVLAKTRRIERVTDVSVQIRRED